MFDKVFCVVFVEGFGNVGMIVCDFCFEDNFIMCYVGD